MSTGVIRQFTPQAPKPPRSFDSFATYTMRHSGGYERRRVYSVLFDGNGIPARGDMVLIDGVRHRVERVMRGGEFTPPGIPIGIMVEGDVGDGRG